MVKKFRFGNVSDPLTDEGMKVIFGGSYLPGVCFRPDPLKGPCSGPCFTLAWGLEEECWVHPWFNCVCGDPLTSEQ